MFSARTPGTDRPRTETGHRRVIRRRFVPIDLFVKSEPHFVRCLPQASRVLSLSGDLFGVGGSTASARVSHRVTRGLCGAAVLRLLCNTLLVKRSFASIALWSSLVSKTPKVPPSSAMKRILGRRRAVTRAWRVSILREASPVSYRRSDVTAVPA